MVVDAGEDNMKKKSVTKYMTLYMSFGMCFGASFGFILGMFLYPDNMSLGMCFGMCFGMCGGMAIGAAKDKRLSEKMMTITRIESLPDSSDIIIYAIDKTGTEKKYKISKRNFKDEKFAVEDRWRKNRTVRWYH